MAACRRRPEGSTSTMNHTTEPYRTLLNNWLQVNGGTERLIWQRFQVGPENDTTWTAVCLIDNVEWDRASASTFTEAKEEAARKVLRALTFKNIAKMDRFTPH